MAGKKPPTIGDEFAAQLGAAIRAVALAPLDGARVLPALTGLHAPPKQVFVDPQENVLLKASGILIDSGRVYLLGGDIVYETDSLDGNGPSLEYLRTGHTTAFGAEFVLANLMTCRDGPVEFSPPRWFVQLLLKSEILPDRLPRIKAYAARPVFDSNFHLCGPGWHPGSGTLIHGPAVEPVLPAAVAPGGSVVERLPPHLHALLAGFCFRTDADAANTLAMLLTGLLANHFVTRPKGLFLVDGNQPGLGKTLLVRCVGTVLDGTDPRFITFLVDDTELEKRICATLRGRRQSLVFVDNAKVAGGAVISSQAIEANSVAPEVSLRILGCSKNFTRPNDLLWVVTMNDTRVSPDLASRGVPIRLAYEGRPEGRAFDGPPPDEYARENRLAVLGELVGWVVAWNQAGRPEGGPSHRSHAWAKTIGGILAVAGFPEFLANAQEAAATFNAQLDDLAALAEAVVSCGGPFVEVSPLTRSPHDRAE